MQRHGSSLHPAHLLGSRRCKVQDGQVAIITDGGGRIGLATAKRFAAEERLRAYFKSMTPLGRIGLPEEIAAAALFLALSESS